MRSVCNQLLKMHFISLPEPLQFLNSCSSRATFANHLCLRKWSCVCWAAWSASAAHQPILKLCILLDPWWNSPSFWTFSVPHSVTNVVPFPGKCWVLKRAALPGWCSGVIQTKFNQSVWMIFWVIQMIVLTSFHWVLLYIGAICSKPCRRGLSASLPNSSADE